MSRYFLGTDDAGVLNAGAPTSDIAAFTLGTLYASGGTVTLDASTIEGTGNITANGGASITVINESPDYLVLGAILIPNLPGGSVIFTGEIDQSEAEAAGIEVEENGEGVPPSITISNSFEGTVGDSALGPLLILSGTIENLAGLVTIENLSGSLGQVGSTLGKQVNYYVPHGSFVVNISGDTPYYAGGNPYSEWQNGPMIWPGGNPGNQIVYTKDRVLEVIPSATGAPDANLAITWAANARFNASGEFTTAAALTRHIMGHAGDPANGIDNVSNLYYGAATAFAYGDASQATAKALSPIDQSYALANSGGYYAMIPVQTLNASASSYSAASLTGSQDSSAIIGGEVSIIAKTIDINGKISAGTATDWSLDLSQYLVPLIAVHQLLFDAGLGSPRLQIPIARIQPGDSPIKAVYDASSKQIFVDEVVASSGAGFVSLKGAIISSNPLGNIHVNGGLGEVTINNNTGIPLVINKIYAESASLGGDSSSTVEIIDTRKDAASNHTAYVHDAEQGLRVYQGAASTSLTDLKKQTPISTPTGNETRYEPQDGLRWEWKLSAQLTREVTKAENDFLWTAGNWTWADPLTNDPWKYNIPLSDGSGFSSQIQTTPVGRLVVRQDSSVFTQTITTENTQTRRQGIAYHNGNFGFAPDGRLEDDGRTISPWIYRFVTAETLAMTNSVKADNPINIAFSGSAEGQVSITSDAPVSVRGAIINPSGDTRIIAAGVDASGDGAISSKNLRINTSAGVGSASSALPITPADGGSITVVSGSEGVYLSFRSGAVIGQISSGDASTGYGDVIITALSDLTRLAGLAPSTVNVIGRNISLASTLGAIGSLDSFLVLRAHTTLAANGGTQGGRVDVSAQDDIHIEQRGGDLLVGAIVSTAGNVYVRANEGGIFNASGQTAAQTLSDAQINAAWGRLHLTSATGAEANAELSVTVFEDLVARNYNEYWRLRLNGTVVGDSYTLNAESIALYRPRAAAALNDAEPSDAKVKEYAAHLYAATLAFFDNLELAEDTNLGLAAISAPLAVGQGEASLGPVLSEWRDSPAFAAFNGNFQFAVTPMQREALTRNAVWTENELRYAVSRSALQANPRTPVGIGIPNIDGRDITLEISGKIGQLTTEIMIDLADLQSGNLSNSQKGALAIATAPGDVTLIGSDEQGMTIFFTFGEQADGVTLTGLKVAQTAPFFLDASGELTITADDAVFVQGTGSDIALNTVRAAGEVSITAPGAILRSDASSAPVQITTSGDLRLLAGGGDLGSQAFPLIVDIDGALRSASASGSLYLQKLDGDLHIDSVAAGETAMLQIPGGSLLQRTAGAGLSARILELDVRDGIGETAAPVHFTLEADGELRVSAGSSVSVESSASANIGSLAAATGDVTLIIAGDINVEQIEAVTGDVTLIVSGDINVDQITTASGIARLFADGGIYDHRNDAGSNLNANAAVLKALLGIGSEANPLETALSALEVDAFSDMWVKNFGDMSLGDVTQELADNKTSGELHLELASTLTINEPVNSRGGAIFINASEGIIVNVEILSGGGDVTLTAGTDIWFNAGGFVDTESGSPTVTLLADKNSAGTGGIAMTEGSYIQARAGLIDLHAPQDISLSLLQTTGEVRVTSATGSILDADTEIGGPADIAAPRIILSAQQGIGSASNDLEIAGAAGSAGTLLTATAPGDIRLTQVHGELRVASVRSTDGDVFLSVRDSPVPGDDLFLQGTVHADSGSIYLIAGDNVRSQGALLEAATRIEIKGQHPNGGPAAGVATVLNGSFIAPLIDIYGTDLADTITVEPVALQGRLRVWGLGGGDELRSVNPNLTDTIDYSSSSPSFYGGPGNDRLLGGTLNEALYGDSGEDDLRGGAGDDELWGGPDTDRLEGQDGHDSLYGGSGIDFLILDRDPSYTVTGDRLHGHFCNRVQADAVDDNATDILLIEGTNQADFIRISEVNGRLGVNINDNLGPDGYSTWRDANGVPVVEQFQIHGLAGNDDIGFSEDQPVDFTLLANRSSDYLSVINGGLGNDTLHGTPGPDRIDGGIGSDTLYGYAGNDQLWGDMGQGSVADHDTLYAGAGNDDLLSGRGSNSLYAWSRDPDLGQDVIADGPSENFGIFVDAAGALYDNDGGGLYQLEDTGLNRMLGGARADHLFGGTGLDFLYGNGGDDVLYRRDGRPFESLDGGLVEGDEWKEYAKESTELWYYGGTNANDVITVDFVTQPGLLGDHHLITRLTEVDGNFSFDASVRLDFRATDDQGELIWQAQNVLNLQVAADGESGIPVRAEQPISQFLPAEGDFQAIIIDALDGDDQVIVGPTVQKTVWVDAGPGNDQVRILGGNSILADKTELGTRNDDAAFAHDLGNDLLPADSNGQRFSPDQTEAAANTAHPLGELANLLLIQGLTLHEPNDVDRFSFTLTTAGAADDAIHLSRLRSADHVLALRLFDSNGNPVDAPSSTEGLSTSLNLSGIPAGDYQLEVSAAEPNPRPVGYLMAPSVGTAAEQVLDLGLPGPPITEPTQFTGLTLDGPNDIDFYRLRLSFDAELVYDDALVNLAVSVAGGDFADVDSSAPLLANTEYRLKVSSDALPGIYSLSFQPAGGGNPAVVDLATRSNSVRRDIILGGEGNDVLSGGPGQDWIFGQGGNDVLTGGLDRNAADLLFGGDGDDTFQLIADYKPLLTDGSGATFIPTFSDQLLGGAGEDRLLFLGGDFDRRGLAVPDYVSLRYNTGLYRYEFTSLVWDIGTQAFRTEAGEAGTTVFQQQYMYFQTRDIEHSEFDLRAGDDTVRLDPEFKFLPIEGGGSTVVDDAASTVGLEEWGIDIGDFERGAWEAAATIRGGAGNDQLFGGALDDIIEGGPGHDFLAGGPGNDDITGGGGSDMIYGNTPAAPPAPYPASPGQLLVFEAEAFVYQLASPVLDLDSSERPGVDLNAQISAPLGAIIHYSFDDPNALGADDSGHGNDAGRLVDITASASGVSGGAASYDSVDARLLLQGDGIDLGAEWTMSAWFKNVVETPTANALFRGSPAYQVMIISDGAESLGTYVNGFHDSGYDVEIEAWKDQWHQLSVVRNGTGQNVAFYIDGVYVGASEASDEVNRVYSIGNADFPDDSGQYQFAEQLDEVYIYDRALTDAELLQLHDANAPISIDTIDSLAFGLENAVGGTLSTLRSVGDFNEDGFDDFITSSATHSYLLFGPVELSDLEAVDTYAEIIIDHAALGRPGQGVGDVNNDGRADLTFVRTDGDDSLVTVIFGRETSAAGTPWPRLWDASFVRDLLTPSAANSNSRVIRLPGIAFSDNTEVSTHLLETTGDAHSDLLVVRSSNTSGIPSPVSGRYNFGYVYSGQVIAGASTELGLSDRLAAIETVGDIPILQALAAGDMNGDGLDEILFGGLSLVPLVTPTPSMLPGTVLYYSFDNPNALGADESGNGHNAVADTGLWPTPEGVRGGAAFVDEAIEFAPFAASEEWSIAAWFKSPSSDSILFIADARQGVAVSDLELGWRDYSGGFFGSGYFLDSEAFANEWHHITVVGDAAGIRFYIDGSHRGEVSEFNSSEFTASDTFNAIGGGLRFAVDPFAEQLDEVHIFSRALSVQDVKHLSERNQPLLGIDSVTPAVVSGVDSIATFPGLSTTLTITVGDVTEIISVDHVDGPDAGSAVEANDLVEQINAKIVDMDRSIPAGAILHYSFDDPGALGADDSGHGNEAGTVTGIEAAVGLVGGAAHFSGSAAKLLIGSAGVDAGSEWTASAWFKDMIKTDEAVLFKSPGGGYQAIVVDHNSANLGDWQAGAFSDSGYDVDIDNWVGEWHQLTVVGAGGKAKYYLDGQFVGTVERQASNIFYAVGSHDTGVAQFAEQLDEVYIYDRALTDAEVLHLHNANAPGKATGLAHRVTASLVDGKIEFATLGGGSNVQLSVLESVDSHPLGFSAPQTISVQKNYSVVPAEDPTPVPNLPPIPNPEHIARLTSQPGVLVGQQSVALYPGLTSVLTLSYEENRINQDVMVDGKVGISGSGLAGGVESTASVTLTHGDDIASVIDEFNRNKPIKTQQYYSHDPVLGVLGPSEIYYDKVTLTVEGLKELSSNPEARLSIRFAAGSGTFPPIPDATISIIDVVVVDPGGRTGGWQSIGAASVDHDGAYYNTINTNNRTPLSLDGRDLDTQVNGEWTIYVWFYHGANFHPPATIIKSVKLEIDVPFAQAREAADGLMLIEMINEPLYHNGIRIGISEEIVNSQPIGLPEHTKVYKPNPNMFMPVADDYTTVTLPIEVSHAGLIADVNVVLDEFASPYRAALNVFLISPSGTRVELLRGTPGEYDPSSFATSNTRLDDDAGTVIAGPFTSGYYQPVGNLSDLIGEDPDGEWMLEIVHPRNWEVEVEGNNSVATAQNLGGLDLDGLDLSLVATGDGTADYFSFSVDSPQTVTLDIDANNFNAGVALSSSAGSALGHSVGETGDAGDGAFPAGYFSYALPAAGTYVVQVWNHGVADPPSGGEYTLHISRATARDARVSYAWHLELATSVVGAELSLTNQASTVPLTGQLPDDGRELLITLSGDNAEGHTPYRLGDLDGDGYDELARVSPTGLDIYRGQVDPATLLDTVWLHVAGSGVSPAAGDFNGDGKRDLAILIGSTIGIFRDLAAYPPEASSTLLLSDADASLNVTASTASLAAADLNGDRVDDLLIATGSESPAEFGRSYVIYGARTRVELPDDFTTLESISFPGGGSFVVEDENANPIEFDYAGSSPRTGENGEAWFRFSTQGDGQAGDAIRMISHEGAAPPLADLIDAEGHILQAQRAIFDLRALAAGTYYLRLPPSQSLELRQVELLRGVGDGGGPNQIEISPDGRNVYITTGRAGAQLAVFERDPVTGSLTVQQVLENSEVGDGLANGGLSISPDGLHVYISSSNADRLSVLHRDPNSGLLTFQESLENVVPGDGRADKLSMSPDGRYLYVTNVFGGGLAVFSREPETGSLTFQELVDTPTRATFSPDGRNAYFLDAGTLHVFERDPETGALEPQQTLEDDLDVIDGLAPNGPDALAISPDGRNVYVAGSGDHALAIYRRDPTGLLTPLNVLIDGVDGIEALDSPRHLTVGPDGLHVYVLELNSLSVFERDPATGLLTNQVVLRDGTAGVDGLRTVRGVIVSPEGAHLYVTENSFTAELQQLTVFATDALVSIAFDAPDKRHTHESETAPDRDTIHGGDGDDTIVGSPIAFTAENSGLAIASVGALQIPIFIRNGGPRIQSLNGPDLIAQAGDELAFDASDVTAATYLWEVSSNNGQVIPPSSAMDFSFTPAYSGVYTVSLTATDADGGSSSLTRIYTILPVLSIAASGNFQPGSAIQLDASGSTPQGPLGDSDVSVERQYLWSSDAAGDLSGEDTATAQFVFTNSGEHTFTLTVTDVFKKAGKQTHALVSSEQYVASVNEDGGVSITATLADDVVTLTASGLPAIADLGVRSYVWLVNGEDSGTVDAFNPAIFRFSPTEGGDFVVSLTVTDAFGDELIERTASTTIAIENANEAPILQLSIGPIIIDELSAQSGSEIPPLELNAYFRDPDNDSLIYTLVPPDDDQLVAEIYGDELYIFVAEGFSGTVPLTVRATDPDGLFVDAPVTVIVRSVYAPADRNKDWQIDASELAEFAETWKRGASWDWDVTLDVNSADFSQYVLDSIAIWKAGGDYHRVADDGAPPAPANWQIGIGGREAARSDVSTPTPTAAALPTAYPQQSLAPLAYTSPFDLLWDDSDDDEEDERDSLSVYVD